MIARLHRTLLASLPLPFAAAFATLMFLLLMQFLIRYLPELVGRGLPVGVLAELVAYSLAYMVTLAVPMAWLIALLAAFGRLGESRAYAVARSAGISLPRLAWPVAAVGLGLTLFAGYFNNEMLPEANYRMNGLWRDIRVARPGFALTPGVFFTGLDGVAVRADSIPADGSGRLLGVTVFETRPAAGGQAVLTAAEARLEAQTLAGGAQRLTMALERGEIHRRDGGPGRADAYERLAFERYRMAFEPGGLGGFERREGGGSRTDRSMRTSDMLAVVDSLETAAGVRADSVRAALARAGRTPGDAAAVGATLLAAPADALPAAAPPRADSLAADSLAAGPAVLRGLSAAERRAALDLAASRVQAVRVQADLAASAARWEGQQAARYRVEIYKKNSIALACLVFVLVGVPLGLSVSRAGVGLVASLAVVLFLFYWITLVQGEKLADRDALPPWLGMWGANLVVGALGLYLFAREALDPAWPDPVRWLAGRFARRG